MASPDGDWLWHKFQDALPQHVCLRIAAIKGPVATIAADSITWVGTLNRQFSVKSAYYMRSRQEFGPHDVVWSLLSRFRQTEQRGAVAVAQQHAPLAWLPPLNGWVKVNTDGSRTDADGRTSCGGAVRDATGNKVADHMAKLVRKDVLATHYYRFPPPSVIALLNGEAGG
ncbi:hypothetical protein V6N13_110995 [Hibiscus sabdariffa]